MREAEQAFIYFHPPFSKPYSINQFRKRNTCKSHQQFCYQYNTTTHGTMQIIAACTGRLMFH